jgi:hypothetical protein
MTGYRAIAKRIPDSIRSRKLMTDADPIGNALASSGDANMILLFAIWSEFVEPMKPEDIGCSLCVRRVLRNFKEIKDDLIELEKEHQLYKTLNERARC